MSPPSSTRRSRSGGSMRKRRTASSWVRRHGDPRRRGRERRRSTRSRARRSPTRTCSSSITGRGHTSISSSNPRSSIVSATTGSRWTVPTPRSTARRVSAIPMLAAALGVTLQERFLPYHGGFGGRRRPARADVRAALRAHVTLSANRSRRGRTRPRANAWRSPPAAWVSRACSRRRGCTGGDRCHRRGIDVHEALRARAGTQPHRRLALGHRNPRREGPRGNGRITVRRALVFIAEQDDIR